jgi:hypothetical protein
LYWIKKKNKTKNVLLLFATRWQPMIANKLPLFCPKLVPAQLGWKLWQKGFHLA